MNMILNGINITKKDSSGQDGQDLWKFLDKWNRNKSEKFPSENVQMLILKNWIEYLSIKLKAKLKIR